MGGVFSSSNPLCDEQEVKLKDDLVEGPEFRVTGWDYHLRDYQSLSSLKPKLRAGDMVSVARGRIEHFLVYIGNGYCVHFYAQGGERYSSTIRGTMQCIVDYVLLPMPQVPDNVADQPGVVALEPLDSAVGKDRCRIDNRIKYVLAHGLRKRRKGYKIVEEARKVWEAAQKSPPYYNIASYNCEVFALELRYGVRIPANQFIRVNSTNT